MKKKTYILLLCAVVVLLCAFAALAAVAVDTETIVSYNVTDEEFGANGSDEDDDVAAI